MGLNLETCRPRGAESGLGAPGCFQAVFGAFLGVEQCTRGRCRRRGLLGPVVKTQNLPQLPGIATEIQQIFFTTGHSISNPSPGWYEALRLGRFPECARAMALMVRPLPRHSHPHPPHPVVPGPAAGYLGTVLLLRLWGAALWRHHTLRVLKSSSRHYALRCPHFLLKSNPLPPPPHFALSAGRRHSALPECHRLRTARRGDRLPAPLAPRDAGAAAHTAVELCCAARTPGPGSSCQALPARLFLPADSCITYGCGCGCSYAAPPAYPVPPCARCSVPQMLRGSSVQLQQPFWAAQHLLGCPTRTPCASTRCACSCVTPGSCNTPAAAAGTTSQLCCCTAGCIDVASSTTYAFSRHGRSGKGPPREMVARC